MISERQFAQGFGSFWKQLLPDGDRFIRKMNLSRERFGYEVENNAPGELRGVVNETAFVLTGLAKAARENRPLRISFDSDIFVQALEQASMKIALLEGRRDFSGAIELDDQEKKEVLFLTDSTNRFLTHLGVPDDEILFQPHFRGCGFVQDCYGDIGIPGAVVEIKAGDRNFRSTDMRQAIIYVVLHYAATGELMNKVVLANPRSGTYTSTALEDVCLGMGAESPEAVVRQIINFACGMANSK